MRKVVPIEGKDLLVQVLGIHDSNIRKISEITGAKIYIKKNEIQIFGSRQVVDKAHTVIDKIVKLIGQGASITPAEIEELLLSRKPVVKQAKKREYREVFRKD